jgi:hypothetical protein
MFSPTVAVLPASLFENPQTKVEKAISAIKKFIFFIFCLVIVGILLTIIVPKV